MKGFIYRTAVAVKDLGERLRWAWLIRLGYWIRNLVMKRNIKPDGGKRGLIKSAKNKDRR